MRSPDAGWDAHRAAIAHLHACGEALLAQEDDAAADVPSPAVGPYCGCSDCDVREVLAVAWPILLDDAAAMVELAGHAAAGQVLRAELARMPTVIDGSADPRGAP